MRNSQNSNGTKEATGTKMTFREALAVLPLCAIRLLVGATGELTGNPRWLIAPKEVYDQSNWWFVSRIERGGEWVGLRLVLETNKTLHDTLQEELRKQESRYAELLNRVKNIKEARAATEDAGDIQRHMAALVDAEADIEATKANIAALKKDCGYRVVTWEFSLEDICADPAKSL